MRVQANVCLFRDMNVENIAVFSIHHSLFQYVVLFEGKIYLPLLHIQLISFLSTGKARSRLRLSCGTEPQTKEEPQDQEPNNSRGKRAQNAVE